MHPQSDSPADAEAARVEDAMRNRWILDPVLLGAYPEDGMRRFGGMLPPLVGDDMRMISAPSICSNHFAVASTFGVRMWT
jgi:beta-glucosidase